MGKKINKNDNYLDLIPSVRDGLKWKEADGIVTIFQENKGFFNGVAQKFFGRPKVSEIELDKFGSFVWLSIDGAKNIAKIGEAVKAEFGDEAEPLYERLSKYFNTLDMLHYVTLKRPVQERTDTENE